MIRLITWCDDKMTRSAQQCVDSAKKHGVESADWQSKSFNVFDSFQYFNSEILNSPRGAGFWLFKPYCIMEAIGLVDDGDTLIYCDAGCEFVDDVQKVIACMDQDIMFFTNGFAHVEWCKGDVLEGINSFLFPYVYEPGKPDKGKLNFTGDGVMDFKQVQASLIIFKVNQTTRNFVKEWLLWCQMPGYIDDSPSKLPNWPTFAEHRHDQAILCCMQIKHGYKLHWFPSTMNMHRQETRLQGDVYPPIINHHRLRNKGFGNGDAEWPDS